MIKINRWYSQDIIDWYVSIIEPKVKEAYDLYADLLNTTEKAAIFDDSSGNYSKDKVIRLLSAKRYELFQSNDIRKYFQYEEKPIVNKQLEADINYIISKLNIKNMKANGFIDRKRKTKNKYFQSLLNSKNLNFNLPDNIITFKEFEKYLYAYLYGTVRAIISYDLIDESIRHKLISSLGVEVCPYCNRQYINSWKETLNNQVHITADLDHFYPKSKFPLFSLSLFNFVPSCQICNQRMKGGNFSPMIYPFEEKFGSDAIFVIDNIGLSSYEELKILQGTMPENINISFLLNSSASDEIKNKINKSIEQFKLKEIYQSHSNYVAELLVKKRIYSDGTYLEMLKNQFVDLKLNESELDVFLYGFNWQDGENIDKPLSKLTYDIIKR